MKRGVIASLCLMLPLCVWAAEVRVAVAANFAGPMKDLAAVFESQTGHKLLLTPGASGKFYAQITNGAPFDVFLSADDETPQKLEKVGKAVQGSRFTYAIGRLILWSPKDNGVADGIDILKKGDFRFLAIANPRVAPYGIAAVQTMQKIGVLSKLEPKVVQGENISQTHQFVTSGNADLGFVALSQVWQNGKLKSGSGWLVPETYHDALRQDAVLLEAGKQSEAAQALMNFLKSEKAREIMTAYGYKH
jgi:molybdate transport system substrate-binding protein